MASLEDLLHSPLRPFLPFSGEKFLGEFFGVPWELVLQGEYIAGFFESVYFPLNIFTGGSSPQRFHPSMEKSGHIIKKKHPRKEHDFGFKISMFRAFF